MTKKELLNKIPESNTEWAAQMIAQNWSNVQLMELEAVFNKLDKDLYKSWADEMTFKELKESVKIVMDLGS